MPKKKKENNEELVEEMIKTLPSGSESARRVAPVRETRLVKDTDESPQFTEEAIEELRKRRTVQATRRKRTASQWVANTLFGDATRELTHNIWWDVLVPAAKTMIQDGVQTFIEMALFGEARPRNKRERGGTQISYSNMYRGGRDENRRERRGGRDRFGLEDIYFDTAKQANDALEELCEQLEEYEWVTVADYLGICGLNSTDWVANKWGWTGDDTKQMKCRHVPGGYAVILPEPQEVK